MQECLEVDPPSATSAWPRCWPTSSAARLDPRSPCASSTRCKAGAPADRGRGRLAVVARSRLVDGAAARPARRPRPRAPAGLVRTLAIVPFTNATGSAEMEWLRSGLPDMLVTDLSQSQYVRPVPGERVFRVLEESGLDKQTRFDEKALEAVSQLAHAESVLSGQFVESGGKLRLDLNLRKAGSGVSEPLKVEGRRPRSSASSTSSPRPSRRSSTSRPRRSRPTPAGRSAKSRPPRSTPRARTRGRRGQDAQRREPGRGAAAREGHG